MAALASPSSPDPPLVPEVDALVERFASCRASGMLWAGIQSGPLPFCTAAVFSINARYPSSAKVLGPLIVRTTPAQFRARFTASYRARCSCQFRAPSHIPRPSPGSAERLIALLKPVRIGLGGSGSRFEQAYPGHLL